MNLSSYLRKFLDALYLTAGVAAGLAMVAVFVLVCYQIVCRTLMLPTSSVDELAAYGYVATTFLGLASSHRMRSHIRVSLLIDNLKGGVSKAVELLAGIASVFLAGWLSYYMFDFVLDSWTHNEVSQGVIPMMLWIPQSTMFVGCFIFFIALADDLVRLIGQILRGNKPDDGSLYAGLGSGKA